MRTEICGSRTRHPAPPQVYHHYGLGSPRSRGRGRCPDACPTQCASEPPRPPLPFPAGPEKGAGRQPYCHTNATESSRLENQSYLLWRVPASKTSQCFHPPLFTGPIPLRLNKKKRRGRGQEHSRWINAPHPAAHVLGKQEGLERGFPFYIFCVCLFLFVVRGRLCSSMFFVVLIFFVVVPCCSLSFSLCHFCFPFFVFFCMRTRSRQWLQYSFFIIVCRLWSVIFMPPFLISRVRTMLFTVVFTPSFCRPFLVIFLCPFCLLQSCLLPLVFWLCLF